jgi:glycosyltransferase involved in cell wall biosynthesis
MNRDASWSAAQPASAMRPRTCVIIVENLPVPFDRHVWQEALALRDAGWRVAVICPRGAARAPTRERLEDVEIYRHGLPLEGKGLPGYALEYAAALFHEARLLVWLYLTQGFEVIHACNPPDLIFLIAAPFRLLGVRFVFDHHDLSPELYESRFGADLIHRILLGLERLSFGLADHVLSSNETFRDLAIARGGKSGDQVTVVRTIPDASQLRRMAPDRTARAGKRLVLGYLGVIGFQDGLDHLIEAVRLLRDRGFEDFQTVVVGDGPALGAIRDLAARRNLEQAVSFTGYLHGAAMWAQLSDFDIGVIPDPPNAFNDKISMNKVFEYSALGIPIVTYSLTETRRLLGAAGTYAADASCAALADAVESLIVDDAFRLAKGVEAKAVAAGPGL